MTLLDKWNFYLDFLIGKKSRNDLKEHFNLSYPTVIKYFTQIKEFLKSNKSFFGVYLSEYDKNYLSEAISSGEFKTEVINFSEVLPQKNNPNYMINVPNEDEALFRYYQRKYAIEKHIKIDNAVIIEEHSVSVMLAGSVFEKLGKFSELNLKIIWEAYQPDLWIIKKSAEELFNEFELHLTFSRMKQGKELLVDFVDLESISRANANWGLYQYMDSLF